MKIEIKSSALREARSSKSVSSIVSALIVLQPGLPVSLR
jgi:hypothetical protein